LIQGDDKMKENVSIDMQKSSYKFINIVYPRIKHILYDGRLISCENMYSKEFKDEFKTHLDIEAGVDYALLINGGGMQFISARVLKKNIEELTVRYSRPNGVKTEYEKRMDAIQNNKIFPNLTIQGNVTAEGEFMFAGIISTYNLYRHLNWNKDKYYPRWNDDGSSSYIRIPFSDLTGLITVIY
jgi:hypothetical protein